MRKAKKERISIPTKLSDEVLKQHNRTCCVCRIPNKDVQIHHIDENPSNNEIKNLAVLCLQCHNDTQVSGGFGKKLTSGQVIKFRDEWLEIVKNRNDNLSKGIQPLENQQCWDTISFDNQQGIENAILGLGLNQNNVVSCPKLNIFDEALNRLKLVNYVNIIGESGSGKSISAFQIAYEFYKLGYKVYKYNGNENPNLYSELSPAVYIIDNAHLYKEVSRKIQLQANDKCKVICVYTNSPELNDNGFRITAKQSVSTLYDFYKQNAENIIPIVKEINQNVGFNFSDISYISLIEKASIEKTPYNFNFIIRGAYDYIRTKYDDYEKDEYLDLLAVIAIYQILSADNSLSNLKLRELYTSLKDINLINFDNKLIKQDRILIKDANGYKFSHIRTAIVFLNTYILHSYDNQVTANKIFLLLINNDNYSNLGLLWFINNCPYDVSYSTNRHHLSLFTSTEIDNIYNKIFKKKNEPYFFSVLERLSYHHKIIHNKETRKELLEIINKSEGEDLICIGNFINMLINEANRDTFDTLDYYINNIDFKRVFNLFNESKTQDLYKFVNLFDRVSYRIKHLKINLVQNLNVDTFTQKILNSKLEDFCVLSYLSAIFLYNDRGLINIQNAILTKLNTFLKLFPLQTWVNIGDYFLYEVLGYHKFDNSNSRKKTYIEHRKYFIQNISTLILANEIQNNFLYPWQSVSEFMNFILKTDKNKYLDIIKHIDIEKLVNTTKLLWNTGNEFDILMAFGYNQKFLFELLKKSEKYINKISIDLVYWNPQGAVYLYEKSKEIINYCRNDYILTQAIKNMIKTNRDFAIKLISVNINELIHYVKRKEICGETDFVNEKNEFYKVMKGFEEHIVNSGLSQIEKDILLNYNNYNFDKEKI